MANAKAQPKILNCENVIQHGANALEFIKHGDSIESDLLAKKKVQDLLTQMYVRAKKRGRPRREEEEIENAA